MRAWRGWLVPFLLLTAAGYAHAPASSHPASDTPEGRPPATEASPLQARLDQAPDGAVVLVEPGTYVGDLIIDHPLRLEGRGRPRLVGSGAGSVVRIRAPDVTVAGFTIDGVGGGDLGRDSSGIHASAFRATIRDCRVVQTLFGVYLREADGTLVENCRVQGIPGKPPGEKGSGIHVYDTHGFTLRGNELVDVRDGLYIQSSPGGRIEHNSAHDLRYGLHYMFSDDNVFEDNLFANGDAGTAIMYSKRLVFRRNRFIHNRGFASVGLLFKVCDDVTAEDNLLADNARGVFLEGASRCLFQRNVIAKSDTAIVLFDSCSQVVFHGNSFVANLTPLTLVGKRTDTNFDGNYWSGNDEPDLDGGGRCDLPYRLSNVFDHMRGNLTAANLFTQSFAASALGAAERSFPILEPISVEDHAPLAKPPKLPAVPRQSAGSRSANLPAMGIALVAMCGGFGILVLGRRSTAPVPAATRGSA